MKAISNSAICPNCGGGHKSKPFCLYANGWYCFACGYTKAADRSFTLNEKYPNRVLSYPENCTANLNDWPLNTRLWCYMYNLTDDVIKKHQILLHTPDNTLVFLNIKNNEVVGYTRRDVVTREMKVYGQKDPMLLKSLVAFDTSVKTLVIVEDFISAIRVSKLSDTVCLWGTKCPLQDLAEWFKNYDKILVWLDNDTKKETNSGQEAAKKILEMSQKCIQICDKKRGWTYNSKQAINIVTEKDPKCYYDIEIQQIVRSALNGH